MSFEVDDMSLVFDSYALENVNKAWNTGEGNPGMCFAQLERDHIQGKLQKRVILKAEESNVANRTSHSCSLLLSTSLHFRILLM